MSRHELCERDEGDAARDAVAMYGRLTDFVMPLGGDARHRAHVPCQRSEKDDRGPTAPCAADASGNDDATDSAGSTNVRTALVDRVSCRRRVYLARRWPCPWTFVDLTRKTNHD